MARKVEVERADVQQVAEAAAAAPKGKVPNKMRVGVTLEPMGCSRYRVVGLTNTLDPKIMSALSDEEVRALIDDLSEAGGSVTIRQNKS
jgi:hypothetical protein